MRLRYGCVPASGVPSREAKFRSETRRAACRFCILGTQVHWLHESSETRLLSRVAHSACRVGALLTSPIDRCPSRHYCRSKLAVSLISDIEGFFGNVRLSVPFASVEPRLDGVDHHRGERDFLIEGGLAQALMKINRQMNRGLPEALAVPRNRSSWSGTSSSFCWPLRMDSSSSVTARIQ